MEISFLYVLSQVFIIFNYVFLVITYQLNDRKKILFFNIASLTSAGLSYVCLSAYTGIAMMIISILRNLLFLYNEKRNGKSKKITRDDIYTLIFIYLLTIIFTIFTYNGFLSLMCVFATMIYTYSVWQKSTKMYKYFGILVSICWLIYNIYIRSLFGIVFEFILLCAVIIGIIKDRE